MWRRVVLMVMFSVLSVSVAATESEDVDSEQTFDLTPDDNVLYQPWPMRSISIEKQVQIPPPPPGPYMSSALSNMPLNFPGHAAQNSGTVAVNRPSPLMRPNTPWPVKQFRPKTWSPQHGINYAPPVSNRAPVANRQPVVPMMYQRPGQFRNTNRSSNFPVPQQRYLQLNPRHMYPQMHKPQMNRPQPVWNSFVIPMSNYPRQNQRAWQPVQR